MVSAEKHKIFCQEQELNRQWFRRFRDMLGWNEEKRQSHAASRELLTTIKDDRKHALNRIAGALLQLTQISNDLDGLRDGVATPTIMPDIPIEVHMASIRSGTEQLVNRQIRIRAIGDEHRRQKFAAD